eukprot:TRINITY_DN268859_c0_g1_i1.p1 TRINITY_DN268859_c0_g1~~TRINITY_DN268859_c0_g1_i1.p1  ORF type:complete len:972 (-),score=264.24 TRINITY_DN268859_c0_g1_i1:484-3369(-)
MFLRSLNLVLEKSSSSAADNTNIACITNLTETETETTINNEDIDMDPASTSTLFNYDVCGSLVAFAPDLLIKAPKTEYPKMGADESKIHNPFMSVHRSNTNGFQTCEPYSFDDIHDILHQDLSKLKNFYQNNNNSKNKNKNVDNKGESALKLLGVMLSTILQVSSINPLMQDISKLHNVVGDMYNGPSSIHDVILLESAFLQQFSLFSVMESIDESFSFLGNNCHEPLFDDDEQDTISIGLGLSDDIRLTADLIRKVTLDSIMDIFVLSKQSRIPFPTHVMVLVSNHYDDLGLEQDNIRAMFYAGTLCLQHQFPSRFNTREDHPLRQFVLQHVNTHFLNLLPPWFTSPSTLQLFHTDRLQCASLYEQIGHRMFEQSEHQASLIGFQMSLLTKLSSVKSSNTKSMNESDDIMLDLSPIYDDNGRNQDNYDNSHHSSHYQTSESENPRRQQALLDRLLVYHQSLSKIVAHISFRARMSEQLPSESEEYNEHNDDDGDEDINDEKDDQRKSQTLEEEATDAVSALAQQSPIHSTSIAKVLESLHSSALEWAHNESRHAVPSAALSWFSDSIFEVINNIGVVFAQMGDLMSTLHYFSIAASEGNDVASHVNLLQTLLEDGHYEVFELQLTNALKMLEDTKDDVGAMNHAKHVILVHLQNLDYLFKSGNFGNMRSLIRQLLNLVRSIRKSVEESDDQNSDKNADNRPVLGSPELHCDTAFNAMGDVERASFLMDEIIPAIDFVSSRIKSNSMRQFSHFFITNNGYWQDPDPSVLCVDFIHLNSSLSTLMEFKASVHTASRQYPSAVVALNSVVSTRQGIMQWMLNAQQITPEELLMIQRQQLVHIPHRVGTAKLRVNQQRIFFDVINQLSEQIADLLLQKGNLLIKIDRVPDSITAFEESLKYDPDNPTVCNNMGVLYFHGKDFEKAKLWFERTLLLHPSHDQARSALRRVLDELGESAEEENKKE